jgi:hypothetical protein
MVLVSWHRLYAEMGARLTLLSDGKFNKPWVDGSPTAPRDFIKGMFNPGSRNPAGITANSSTAKDQWLPTWGEGNDRGMTVKSVKMWKEGLC